MLPDWEYLLGLPVVFKASKIIHTPGAFGLSSSRRDLPTSRRRLRWF